MPDNREIAKLLRSVAAAYEVKGGNIFKITAYNRAATAVEHAASELKDLWDDKKLKTLAGIGPSIAQHLDEYFRTGKVRHFQKLMKGLPPAMFVFLELEGIGAKTAFKLCQKLKITKAKNALKKLQKAAQAGKIKGLEGFGQLSEKAILESLEAQKKAFYGKNRMLLPFAWEMAQKVIDYMSQEKAVLKIDPLGSLRRMATTVGDIDLAVSTKKPVEVIGHFVRNPAVKKIVAEGENTARVKLENGRQIDLKTQTPDAYGALLQHFTGSKQHNIHLREVAQKKGLSLSEYGIKKEAKIRRLPTEKAFYQALGMVWIPPELREDTGEIEAAQQKKLPKLVKLEDIKGDLHIHSDFPIEPSHDLGADSMEEMAQKAIKLGYQYIGFAEHNPSTSQHSAKQIINLIKRKKEKIDKLNYSFNKNTRKEKIRLLNSLEIDIKPDGKLAVSDEGLKLLDYAIAAVHTSFKMAKKEMTERVLSGLNQPKVKILAHPTGRKLEEREGYELDWEKVFAFCLKNDKWLEINAWPDRLDLPEVLVKEAVKKGVKMIINTDSHALNQLELMSYGVAVARRGWATAKDVVNTLSWSDINAKLT